MSAPPEATAQLSWDYTTLADTYHLRAPYAHAALNELFALIDLPQGSRAADIGAGTGNLTSALAESGLRVDAVEPNAAMRAHGVRRVPAASWRDARGEATGLADAAFDLVTLGSSFNVMRCADALAESARLLRGGGWLAMLWNHRDLDDPHQRELQRTIESHVPDYQHGSRRDDPSAAVRSHGRFDRVHYIEGRFRHVTSAADFVEGFRSHATLVRQAGYRLPAVLAALNSAIGTEASFSVPFVTRIYAAQRLHLR